MVLASNMSSGEPIGGTSARLWSECKQEAYQALRHPFVRALGEGTLPREHFRSYIAQDVFYLDAFAKAYAIAVSKAADLPGNAAYILSDLHKGVGEELKTHTTYAENLGVTPREMYSPNPSTLKYTTFLLDVAAKMDVAHILAAMAPCSRLYGFIGCKVAAEHPEHEHEYSDWIRTYSGASYLELPAKKEQLLNTLAGDCDFGELLKLYRTAMRLEVEFFDANCPATWCSEQQ